MSISVLRQRSELGPFAAACVDLALHCAEPARLDQTRLDGTRCVLAWVDRQGSRELGALFPFAAPAPYRGLALLAMTTGTPLMRAGCEHACLHALLDWFRRDGEGAALLEFRALARGGPVCRALAEVAAQREQLVLATGARDGSRTLLVGDGTWQELDPAHRPPLRWAKRCAAALIYEQAAARFADPL